MCYYLYCDGFVDLTKPETATLTVDGLSCYFCNRECLLAELLRTHRPPRYTILPAYVPVPAVAPSSQ